MPAPSFPPKTPKPEACDLKGQKKWNHDVPRPKQEAQKKAALGKLSPALEAALPAQGPRSPVGPFQVNGEHPHFHPSPAPCNGGGWHLACLSKQLKVCQLS